MGRTKRRRYTPEPKRWAVKRSFSYEVAETIGCSWTAVTKLLRDAGVEGVRQSVQSSGHRRPEMVRREAFCLVVHERMTPTEAARELGVHSSYVHYWVAIGQH